MNYKERGKIRIEFSPEEVKVLRSLVGGEIAAGYGGKQGPGKDVLMLSCLPGLFAKLARAYNRTAALPVHPKA